MSFLPAEPHQGIEFRMSFEMNKVAGAILVAMIVAMVSGIIASKLVEPTPLKKNAYEVAATPEAKSSAQTPAGPQPIEPLLASASIEAGKAHTSVCLTCHTFDKGGANKIGPNLYAIVGAPIAEGRDGYAFSDALKAKGKGQTWTVDELNAWLTDPQHFAPGTKMTFAGDEKAKDRADIIAYLNSLSDHPQPLPTAAPAQPAAATPAGGAQPTQAAAPAPESFDALLATVSADAGKAHIAVCQTCHTFDKGGANKIGPNLYAIVGAPIAEGRNNYPFSDALKAKGKGQTWTVDELNAWLTDPQHFAPGTKMTYAGDAKAKERAEIIAYLNSLSDHPLPLSKTQPSSK
ncbi:MAG TPA: c-type cytochrome [Stellaceae bacterium]|nr:c-type cytochrome [Stellaceae bacterium]